MEYSKLVVYWATDWVHVIHPKELRDLPQEDIRKLVIAYGEAK